MSGIAQIFFHYGGDVVTGWKRAWQTRCKTRGSAKLKKWLKRQNHRLNRLVAKTLAGEVVRLNGRDVT
ncbi:hypothetical protein EBZ39_11065 [bacterium]|nr:hypothetical protein [bacterium]